MPTIAIREEQQTETGFTAMLSIDGRVNYSIEIVDPFTGKDERNFECSSGFAMIFTRGVDLEQNHDRLSEKFN